MGTASRLLERALINVDLVPFTPATDDAGRRCEFQGRGAIGRLITGSAKAVVSPTGFEPVLLP